MRFVWFRWQRVACWLSEAFDDTNRPAASVSIKTQQQPTDLQTLSLKCCTHTLCACIYSEKKNKSR